MCQRLPKLLNGKMEHDKLFGLPIENIPQDFEIYGLILALSVQCKTDLEVFRCIKDTK